MDSISSADSFAVQLCAGPVLSKHFMPTVPGLLTCRASTKKEGRAHVLPDWRGGESSHSYSHWTSDRGAIHSIRGSRGWGWGQRWEGTHL